MKIRSYRSLPILTTVCLILTFAAGVAAESAFRTPPPLPTAEDRARFVASHHASLDPTEWQPADRDIHDEYDVLHYDIDLSLDIPSQILTGRVELEASSQTDGLAQVELDFYMPMDVDAVTVGGVPTSFSHVYHTLTVDLDRAYDVGEIFSVECDYHGTPVYANSPFRWNNHGGVPMVLSYSEPYGAPAWWVCKDDPKDKATFAIHVTAPAELSTVSNGRLESVTDNGDGTATYHWTTDYPMSTYLFSIATTNFQSWTETYTALDGFTTMDVHYFAYPEDFADAQADWSGNIAMMEYFAGIFGEYPFLDEKYAIAEFAHSGAMEHQTATSYGSNWITGNNNYDYVVVHELAHSWVGDMITMTEWSHAWCKEGFATFCEATYFETLYGESYYHSYMNNMQPLNYGNYQLFDISPPLHAAIYYKGAWVLHMLRHVIGDEDFFAAIYAYTNDDDFRYGVADTEDMREVFEAISGMDLVWFFDEWIYHPGYPRYEIAWGAQPEGGGYDVNLQIVQVQSDNFPIFKMPIDVVVEFGLDEERFVVWDSLPSQSFQLHVDQLPVGLELDPDEWIIRQVETVTGVVASGPAEPGAQLSNWPNPFNPSTTIRFSIVSAGPVRLEIYDVSGRLVRQILDEVLQSGRYDVAWDGRSSLGEELPSGVYFHRLITESRNQTGRMVLLR